MKKIVLYAGGVVGFVLLVSGSVAGTLFLTGALDKPPPVAAALPEPPLPEDVIYYNIQPEFVVNFPGAKRVQFLMIEMVAATHDEKVPDILTEHDPELRNSLLMLLAEQNSASLKTAEGKQALRDAALSRINDIVGRHYRTERVHDVFITRLVMQ
ncbi:MAG: flagellar basal body-associated protein FliL [Granulosicoccus sp.]